jgi:cell pole-organizing protein PopZ
VINPDELISDSARGALGRVFENLDEPEKARAPRAAGGSIEAVFERAIAEAFEPVLVKWLSANTDEVMQRMRPLILEWMDENLPTLIEAAVQKEIARAVKTRRR